MLESQLYDYSSYHPDESYQGEPIQSPPSPAETSTVSPAGVSSIEESKAVIVELPPSMGQPQLSAYNSEASLSFANLIESISNGNNHNFEPFLIKLKINNEDAINQILNQWSKSLEEQAELVRDRLKSPFYRELLEILRYGNDGSAIERLDERKPVIMDLTERLQAQVDQLNRSEEPTNIAIGGTTSVMMIGSLLAVSADPIVTGPSNSPLESVDTITSYIQPIIPENVLLSDTLMAVNLFALPLLYQVSWEKAVDHLKSKSQPTPIQVASKFAEEVIKAATTPGFIMMTMVDQMEKVEKLPPEQKEKMAALIKLVLSVVAYAFLYRAETGGMTGREIADHLKALLSKIKKNPKIQQGDQKAMLAKIIDAQLGILGPEESAKALEGILAYLEGLPKSNKLFEKMFEPAKVFANVFEQSSFHPDQEENVKA